MAKIHNNPRVRHKVSIFNPLFTDSDFPYKCFPLENIAFDSTYKSCTDDKNINVKAI